MLSDKVGRWEDLPWRPPRVDSSMGTTQLGIRARSTKWTGLVLLSCIAMLFGLASALLPAWFVLSVLLVPAVAMIALVRPELGLSALVALTCGLIHPAFIPRLPFLGGSVAAADVILVILFVYAVFVLATQDRQVDLAPVAGASLLAVALGLFGAIFAIDVVISLWVREVNPTWVLGEARRLVYLIALPVAVVVLRQRERQKRFVISIVVLGCLFSVGQILQGIFSIEVFGGQGRIVVLETLGRQDYGTNRTLTLGIAVIVFALLLLVGAYALDAVRRQVFFPLAGLLVAGIFLSLGRTTFAVVAVCVIVVLAWLNLRKLPELAFSLVLVIAVSAALVSIWKPDSLAAVYFRMTSIGAEIESGYSAQFRYWEAEEMLPHIQRFPFAGIGLGAEYKASDRLSKDPDLDRYVHNAYIHMAGKMGIPALISFLLAICTILAIGRRSAKSNACAWTRVVGAACAGMMINFLLASVTEPHFMVDYSLVVIAIAGALVYLSARTERGDSRPAKSDKSLDRTTPKSAGRAAPKGRTTSVPSRRTRDARRGQ